MRIEVWSLSLSGGTHVPDLGVFSRLFPAMRKCLLSPDLARSLGPQRVNTQNAAARRKQNTWQNIFGRFAISHRVFAKGPAAQRSCRQQVLSINTIPQRGPWDKDAPFLHQLGNEPPQEALWMEVFFLWPKIWVKISTSSHTCSSGVSPKKPDNVLNLKYK